MAENKFIYGIGAVRFQDNIIGYIEKGSWDWGGYKPQVTDIEAEQVPDAPVLSLVDEDGGISPTFNLIRLDYGNLQQVLGGTMVGTTGWQAPTELITLVGKFAIDMVSGQTVTIPAAALVANLGGKLTLTEVSKVECQLKIEKPANGTSAYRIGQTEDTCRLLCYLANGGGSEGSVMLESAATGVTDEDCSVYVFYPRGMEKNGHYYLVPAVFFTAYGYAKHFSRYGEQQELVYQRDDTVLFYRESEDMTLNGEFRGEEAVKDRASGGDWHRLTAGSSLSALVQGLSPNATYTVKIAARNMGTTAATLTIRFRSASNIDGAEETLTWNSNDHSEQETRLTTPDVNNAIYISIENRTGNTSNACIDYIIIT